MSLYHTPAFCVALDVMDRFGRREYHAQGRFWRLRQPVPTNVVRHGLTWPEAARLADELNDAMRVLES